MFIQPYSVGELRFAYSYRVYLRWRTYRGKPCSSLLKLDKTLLETLVSDHDIHLLQCASDETNVLTQVSLKPTDVISACASKLKGRLSKWLNQELALGPPTNVLSRGYFAYTVGKSTRKAVEEYLNIQANHHGYAKRVLPRFGLKSTN